MSFKIIMVITFITLLISSNSTFAEPKNDCTLDVKVIDEPAADFKVIVRSLKLKNLKFTTKNDSHFSIIRHNSTCHVVSKNSNKTEICKLMVAELIIKNNLTGESIYYEGHDKSSALLRATAQKAISELVKTMPRCE